MRKLTSLYFKHDVNPSLLKAALSLNLTSDSVNEESQESIDSSIIGDYVNRDILTSFVLKAIKVLKNE